MLKEITVQTQKHALKTTETASVTLTFVIGVWFFHVTQGLDILNTSAKLYQNPFMQYKGMARTQKTDGQTDGPLRY